MIDRGIAAKDEWPLGVLQSLPTWEPRGLVQEPPLFYYADPSKPVWKLTTFYMTDSTVYSVVKT